MEPAETESPQRLDAQRRTMLLRRGSSQSLDADTMRNAIFEGRPLPMHVETPANPNAVNSSEATDPQRLFQLLRRKKKAPHAMCVSTPLQPMRHTPVASQPQPPPPAPEPPTGCSSARGTSETVTSLVTRPAFSARPFSPADRPPTVSSREVHSAQPGGINGRPFTRQKHPKKSLDLFASPKDAADLQDPFPKPQIPRRSSGGKLSTLSVPVRAEAPSNSNGRPVNFNCLFLKSEDEFDGTNEVFPPQQHKSQANIPLIETDWFTSTAWEQLPTSDGVPQQHDEDLGPEGEENAGNVYAESLYELLVASKRRPLAR
ncbi:Hypothetical protein, putative [Bodo saltans]|uniref:Uncharacterized protein n=1 Tax=Bodo saltans TaxID=75058 RepID=A0A0S4IPG2_BODSA|nr:Hypothetical protein, putative [Bodo saltans]|eukprot:CUF07680.1 Hypothetical protein, putative [Bodo saltans]